MPHKNREEKFLAKVKAQEIQPPFLIWVKNKLPGGTDSWPTGFSGSSSSQLPSFRGKKKKHGSRPDWSPLGV